MQSAQGDRGRLASKPTHGAVGRSQIHTGCCSHQLLTLVPLHEAAQSMAAGFPQSENSERGRGREQSLYNLLSEVTFYHFCLILFIRSKVVGPVTQKGIV